jgi:hypothetical protein
LAACAFDDANKRTAAYVYFVEGFRSTGIREAHRRRGRPDRG